jgi:cyclopropane-fatty-acyl-phospholipid synthase
MNTTALTAESIPDFAWDDTLGYKAYIQVLEKFRDGCLELILPDGSTTTYGDAHSPFRARMRIVHPRAFARMLYRTDVGFSEGFVEGDWDCEELGKLLCLMSWNQKYHEEYSSPLAFLGHMAHRLFHFFHRNTKTGSRRNIEYHYDLGNELYTRFLDESMMYSSALFHEGEGAEELGDAQIRKVDKLLDSLHLDSTHHLLEIGSGWGFAACRAAERFGCKVTSLTLSKEQKALADERIQRMGLEHLVQVHIKDYRDEKGQFDRVLSIEMIEAVGHENLGSYFASIDRCLSPDGLVALQIINMPEDRYDFYLNHPDFIQKHVFPGAVCPSIQAVLQAVSKNSRLCMVNWTDFPESYAKTLAIWRERFLHRWDEIRRHGYDERFKRLWSYYLAYCEAGFRTRRVSVGHLVLGRSSQSNLSSWQDCWSKDYAQEAPQQGIT